MNINDVKIFSLRQGEVRKIFKGHKRLKNKRLYLTILLDTGVIYDNVPFYGAAVDVGFKHRGDQSQGTGRPHGSYFPPVIGQQIGILFVQGHHENPYGAFPIPHPWLQGKGEEFSDKINELIEDPEGDAATFHKSGSYTIYKKNGDIITVTGDVLLGELIERTKVTQKQDGTVRVENFTAAGSDLGFYELDKTTGNLDVNGNATIKK